MTPSRPAQIFPTSNHPSGPSPSLVHTGWLPPYDSESMHTYLGQILDAERTTLVPSVQALGTYIEDNALAGFLMGSDNDGPRINDLDALLHGLNTILTQPPGFIGEDLIGLPFSALVTGIDLARFGVTAFQVLLLNLLMSSILQDWNAFLDSRASTTGFRIEGEEWLSPAVKARYAFPLWKKQLDHRPYWHSWNAFFTRTFDDPETARPVADPASNATVISPNDGVLFRWDADIASNDAFWFKDMRVSLSDMFTSPVPEQQATMDAFNLAGMFEGGYIFQSDLDPYDFHRWWAPVNGEVLFDPVTIPGSFFGELILPDSAQAAMALAPAIARGIIVIKTEDHGHICCIPLGTSEVTSVAFDPAMRAGAPVHKGQEMGMFNYAGSSFAILYEKLPGKELIFANGTGEPYPQRPVQGSRATADNHFTAVGARIGAWHAT
jgi:phosphatidylserine decarboxylase